MPGSMSVRTGKLLFVLFFCYFGLFIFSALAEQSRSEPIGILSESEVKEMALELKSWKDPEVIKFFSETPVTADEIKELNRKFRSIVVSPPEPYSYIEYRIENPQKAILETEQFARIVHNKLLAMSKGAYKRYSKLLALIREVLYLDLKHLYLVIKEDDSRNLYWYILHNGAIKEIDKEYQRLFKDDVKSRRQSP